MQRSRKSTLPISAPTFQKKAEEYNAEHGSKWSIENLRFYLELSCCDSPSIGFVVDSQEVYVAFNHGKSRKKREVACNAIFWFCDGYPSYQIGEL